MSGPKNCAARTTLIALIVLLCSLDWSQAIPPKSATPAEMKPEVTADALGRNSPRGAVLGFLAAARKCNPIAALYLDSRLRGEDAEALAHQLSTVLDRRLPARLNQLSDKPEGS